MFGSILGLPSQIIGTVGNIATGILAIPGQLVGTVTGSINTVANTAGNTIGSVANVAGNTVQGVASTATNFLSNPILIIGVGIVLIVLLKK